MIWIGTSGYSYSEWKGSFYPDKIPAKKMFSFYASHFASVEINNTFYRMPDAALIRGWFESAPSSFRFSLKAPQRMSHIARLRDCEALVAAFVERACLLGDKLGPILVQLPPNFRKDAGLLKGFLECWPKGVRLAFEFRNPSWFDNEVYDALGERNVALCIADSEKLSTPIVKTANYGYLRLRDEGYGKEDIARWAQVISDLESSWQDTFTYFKHESEGKGPEFAKELLALLA